MIKLFKNFKCILFLIICFFLLIGFVYYFYFVTVKTVEIQEYNGFASIDVMNYVKELEGVSGSLLRQKIKEVQEFPEIESISYTYSLFGKLSLKLTFRQIISVLYSIEENTVRTYLLYDSAYIVEILSEQSGNVFNGFPLIRIDPLNSVLKIDNNTKNVIVSWTQKLKRLQNLDNKVFEMMTHNSLVFSEGVRPELVTFIPDYNIEIHIGQESEVKDIIRCITFLKYGFADEKPLRKTIRLEKDLVIINNEI